MANSGPGGEWRSMADKPDFWTKLLPTIGWRLYYIDGSTYDSDMGDCCTAPDVGVAALVAYHAEGRKTIVANYDMYIPPDCNCRKEGGQLGVVDCEDWKEMFQGIVSDRWRPAA